MNLIDIKRKISELTIFITYQKSEVAAKRETVKATRYDKELVKGTTKRKDVSDIIAEIVEMETDIEYAQQEYNRLLILITDLENNYKELNERDKLIYVDRMIKGFSMAKMEYKYNKSDRQIRRIIQKVERNIKMSENVR